MRDVCMVGSGVAGAASAALLARRGLEVVVIDRPVDPARDRREVLSPSALRALADLDLQGPSLRTQLPCRGVLSRWASDLPAFHDYELLECGAGASVSRSEFAHALLDQAITAGASVIRSTSAAAAASRSARVVVDATGRSGRVAPRARRRHVDRTVCVWTTHAGSMRHADVLVLDRARNGWWYASSSGTTSDLAFVTDADCLPPHHLRQQFLISEYRDAALLADSLQGEPSFAVTHATDARTGYRETMAGDGWLAVGDAAIALDPLSGNGIRLAIEGAAHVAHAIDSWLRTGARDGIRSYVHWGADIIERERQARQDAYRQAPRAAEVGKFWRRR
jgi:flavin-dependent dehydrogenase